VLQWYFAIFASVVSFATSDPASVARLFLADLWKSSAHEEIFRVEGHVSVVCKVALQFDNRMSFTARARFFYCILTFLPHDAHSTKHGIAIVSHPSCLSVRPWVYVLGSSKLIT